MAKKEAKTKEEEFDEPDTDEDDGDLETHPGESSELGADDDEALEIEEEI